MDSTLTGTNLASMGRHIPTPFRLSIKHDKNQFELQIESILRIVPGKRIVALTQWQSRPVIVKLFFQPGHWQRNFQADVRGINLLIQSDIPTPKILGRATLIGDQGAVLLMEYLREGTGLLSLLNGADTEADKHAAVEMAVATIASCHKSGVWQQDIHLDNFMFFNERVFVLDGGDIKLTGIDIDGETKMGNLAMFFAQFPVSKDYRIESLFQHYQAQSTELSDAAISSFELRVKKARARRLGSYERKLNRSTTANHCVRTATKLLIYNRSLHSREFCAFVQNPDKFIENGKVLKGGNTTTVAEVVIDDRIYVVKRYNIKKFVHGLRRLFRLGRAYKSWRNASILEMLGVSTPHPYMVLEQRAFWLIRRKAYFLCDRIGADHLFVDFESESANKAETVFAAFEQLLKIMHDYKISHGDMKLSNFIYESDLLHVLDLDSMERFTSARRFHTRFTKDLARFRKNWVGTKHEASVDQLIQAADSSQAEKPKVR